MAKYIQQPVAHSTKNSGDAVQQLMAHEQEVTDAQMKVNGIAGGGRRKSRRRRRRRRKRSRKRRRRSRRRRRYRKRGGGKTPIPHCNGAGCNMDNMVKGQELLMKIGSQAEFDKMPQSGGKRSIRRRGYRNRTRRRGRCVVCLRRF